MKIFLDTANISLIEQLLPTGLVDGVTTNPTLLSKKGGDPTQQVRAISALLPQGAISVEVTETDAHAMYEQAKKIKALADNIVVKIPCHYDYYWVIKKLVQEGVALNITLVFSVAQGVMMSQLGVEYISPFIGRLDDEGGDGLQLVEQLRYVIDRNALSTKILAASVRNKDHFEGALLAGADCITLAPALLHDLCTHSLTNKGIAQFSQDWGSLTIKNFPS
jgi:transaldolase